MSEDFDGSNELEEQEMQDRELLELLDEMKARIGDEAPDLEVPPVDIWAGIESEINGDPGLGSEPGLGAAPGLLSEDSVVTSLDHHRRKRRPAGALLAAVAASVVAAIAFGSILSSNIMGIISTSACINAGTSKSAYCFCIIAIIVASMMSNLITGNTTTIACSNCWTVMLVADSTGGSRMDVAR